MQFRTVPPNPVYPFKLDYSGRYMFVGSCFTEHIGRRMEALKFPVTVNPFGILYNPVAVKNALSRITLNLDFKEEDLVYDKGLWHSLMHHGDFSHPNKDQCLKKINDGIAEADRFLQQSDVLFLTFGTAWAYEYTATGETAGNCHKISASKFKRRLMNADEITIEYYQLLNDLLNYHPDLKVVLSVSPVRHLKNGFYDNTVSKAVLSIAMYQIAEHFDNVYYFPALELMNDDLRDYRFYANDMVHPSSAAVDYIFDFFGESFFTENTKTTMHDIEKIVKAAEHRIMHPGTEENKIFVSTLIEQIEDASKRYPDIDFSKEKQHFESLQ